MLRLFNLTGQGTVKTHLSNIPELMHRDGQNTAESDSDRRILMRNKWSYCALLEDLRGNRRGVTITAAEST